MCGIFGYVGPKNGVKLSIEGLKKIEYRGYDSAGIACLTSEKSSSLQCFRAVGKLSQLQKIVTDLSGNLAIAHTRWATHGNVSVQNAHPIVDQHDTLAVVHNGIIENFHQLKTELQREGVVFRTDTDTEVIANLISKFYSGDLLQAVHNALSVVRGAWAIAVIHKKHPHECVVAAHSCPLVIGLGDQETFIASDPNALLTYTRDVIYLGDGEIARVMPNGVQLFDSSLHSIEKDAETLLHSAEETSKGSFEHYTLKEIFEQPQTIRNALLSRFFEEDGTVAFDDASIKPHDLLSIKRIVIVACGTSWHAGLVGSYMLEELARIPSSVEISSEYRYKNPIVEEGTLAIAISQSGETADTIAAVRELKAKGAKIVALCNVQGSTLTREADATLFLRAGPEIGVCSTKAFTSQLTVLTLFAVMMARLRYLSRNVSQEILRALKVIPQQVEEILAQHNEIRAIAEKYVHFSDFFFIGRRYMYPACLEGALKLKEIAYINANGYAAGEMKHGPIALLSEKCPTLALCADASTYEKMVSNIMEAKARLSPVIAVITKHDAELIRIVDDYIIIPQTRDELAPILTTIVCQMFAYYCAAIRGADIDQPKNLAKSVTVE